MDKYSRKYELLCEYNTTKAENKVESSNYYYTLEWKYVYKYKDDEVYFAQFPPYTFTDLLTNLKAYKTQSGSEQILRTNILCKTIANNDCPLITITENIQSFLPFQYEKELWAKNNSLKKVILNRVEKLRTNLKSKKSQDMKSKVKKYKSHTNESINEVEEVTVSEARKLSEIVDPDYGDEHDLESTFLSNI
jgi:hypothetical protein